MQPEILRVLGLVLCGMSGGVIWDVFRAGSRIFSWTTRRRAAADLLYWFLVGCLLFRFLLSGPEYGWRFYDFAAAVAGSMLYFAWFSRFVLPVLAAIISVLQRVLHAIFRVTRFITSRLFRHI